MTKAAVIGSGFGGLSVAIRLQAEGIQTTIYEARDKPGGRAYVYEQDGFTFDAGPTVITAPHCIDELFELSGRKREDYVKFLPVEPLYRLIWSDGESMDYTASFDAMAKQIARWNPEDVEGYKRFVAYSEDVFHTGYSELAHTPFTRLTDMLKVAPQLARLRADRSVFDTVKRFVSDEHLQQALSFHALLVGGNPFETSSIYTLIHYLERKWGVFFPEGGTGALVRAMVQLFTDLGGEIRLSCPVDSVELDRSTARAGHIIASGKHRERFDFVVSNADLHQTYARLYQGVPEANRMRSKLDRLRWSMSLFVLYFGTDRSYRDDVAHHTVLFGPRYKELLDDIFHGSSLPSDFSLYLHAPTVTDPSMAPPGCGAFYVLSPVPNLDRAAVDWSVEAPRYAGAIYEALEKHLPDLRKHIVTERYMTPFDFRDELRAENGAAFSCAPTLTQSAWFRPHNRDPKVPGLYLVGAGTHPGAGVPGVINSAKATAKLVMEDWAA